MAAFELRFGITLPALFRTFVLEVADGLVYDGASWLYSLDEIAADVSDDALVEELGKAGVTVARRTVTKYRKAMNIPSSRQRRDWSAEGK